MRRIGNLKEPFLSFDNFYSAFKKAYRATKNYAFAFHVDRELFRLQDEFINNRYVPGEYHCFTITEPKERIIAVAPFRDRVVHHALVNIIEPIFEKRFIYDSYATRKDKGTHKAIERAQSFLRKNPWYLKMDIRHYFASINHAVLIRLIERTIKDPFILDLCKAIISRGGAEGTGLPIGNLTSQFFANVYLNAFDQYVHEVLRMPAYLRYMDDFCIFGKEKETLKHLKAPIESFLRDTLKLETKPSATMINNRLHGLPFLGVRIYPNMIRYRKENFKRSLAKLKHREWEYQKGRIDYQHYTASMQSLTAHLTVYGNNLLKSILYYRKGNVSQTVLMDNYAL
jgi:retron-type reverse transcriptase